MIQLQSPSQNGCLFCLFARVHSQRRSHPALDNRIATREAETKQLANLLDRLKCPGVSTASDFSRLFESRV